MENSVKTSVNTSPRSLFRVCTLSFFLLISFIQRTIAQTADVSNLKNSLSSIKEEQEKIAHEEFMSYVYMTVGFAVVIAIAWTTTVMARKRNKREQEEKQRYILKQQELRKHHHGGAVHKARR